MLQTIYLEQRICYIYRKLYDSVKLKMSLYQISVNHKYLSLNIDSSDILLEFVVFFRNLKKDTNLYTIDSIYCQIMDNFF